MPNRKGRAFTGLLADPPKPLPDDAEEPNPQQQRGLAPVPDPVEPTEVEPGEPERTAPELPAQAQAAPAKTRRAATTIRLRQSDAEILEAAWLEARQTDLRLSYPEFAGRVIREWRTSSAQSSSNSR